MNTDEQLGKTVNIDHLRLTNVVDEDLFAFISSLIDQNAELIQKIQLLSSQKYLANSPEIEAAERENTAKLTPEREARDRASGIIQEAEVKAKTEAGKILAEAKMEAERILAEARRKAEEIVEQKNEFATQQGLLIINKAQERALSILDDVQKQAEAITRKAKRNGKG
jgi:vacuolar-type H+-ATPase subunit H